MRAYLLNLFLLAVIGGVLVFWWKTQGVKQLAFRAAQRHCDELGLQLLDQSVMLRGLGIKRHGWGRLRVRRKFGFEFSSTGEERYRGEVWMLDGAVERVAVEPHRI